MARLPFALALALGGLALPPGAALGRPAVGADGLERLGRRQVLTYTDPGSNGINKGKAIGVFDATPDEVFRVVTDFEHYQDFAPRVVAARVVDRQGPDRALVWLASDLPWPVSKAWVTAQFEYDRIAPDVYRIRFHQLQGSMRRYEGSIYIEPWTKWKNGGTSVVTYELLAEPDSMAPRRLINARLEEVVAKYVHFLRQHINELRRAGRLHPELPPDPNLASPLAGSKQPRAVTDVAQRP